MVSLVRQLNAMDVSTRMEDTHGGEKRLKITVVLRLKFEIW